MIPHKDVSFVIPSNRDKITTKESVPADSEIRIPRSAPLGRARNDGISDATRPFIILCDDDIVFPQLLLDFVLSIMENREKAICGLLSYWPSPFLIGRFMGFYKSAWDEVGPFDIRGHGDETEFQIRAIKKGYEIIPLPRQGVTHIPHQQKKPKFGDLGVYFYCIRKHPSFPLWMTKTTLHKMLRSSDRSEYL